MSTIRPDVPHSELEERLLHRLHEGLGIEIPAAEADLLESGLIDSLTLVEILVLVEEEFGVDVEVAELDLDDFRSIRRIAGFVGRQRSGGNGAG